MTLDELAEFLRLPEGHSLHAVDELPAGHCPGVSLTIVSNADAAGKLPHYHASDPLMVMDMATYRRWVSKTGIVRQRLRPVDEPIYEAREDHQAERADRPGRRADDETPAVYTPARPPVAASPEKEWPKFPGEDLPITGEPVRGDPGDEDIHTGGPR